MAKTSVKSEQIKDGGVKRSDVNITQTGEALIRRLIAGTNISLSSTGVDTGTGDVTVSVSSTPNFTSLSIGSNTVIDSSRNVNNIGTLTATGNITSVGTNNLFISNSVTANSWGGFGIQKYSSYKGIFGNAWAVNSLANGAVADDLIIRNSQKIIFTADAGSTIHASISASDFIINTTNLKVGSATGQSGSFSFYNSEDGISYSATFTKGVLTSIYEI